MSRGLDSQTINFGTEKEYLQTPKDGKLVQERTYVSTRDFSKSFWDKSKKEVM